MYVYASESKEDCTIDDAHLLYKRESQPYSSSMDYNEVNITIPMTAGLLNNGTYFAHLFFGVAGIEPSMERGCVSIKGQTHTVYRSVSFCAGR